MKLYKKILLGILAVILSFVAFAFFTPYVAEWTLKWAFEGGGATMPANYAEIEARVEMVNDVEYPSTYKKNTLDIISPKGNTEKLPVVIWVHGGAYVAGDKTDITEYIVQIVDKGYIGININYELATDARYPAPVIQLGEAYEYVQANAERLNIDLNQVIFAGDSAGAQIVAQFINVQVNDDYAKQTGFKQVVPKGTIMGAILFCGPYEIERLNDLSKNVVLDFFITRIGWAYIGKRNWVSSPEVAEATITPFVTADFPPSFISDGNVYTFTDHGLALEARLKELNVPVVGVFYDKSDAHLAHEYQFKMDEPHAQNTFYELIKFLDQIDSRSIK